MRKYLKQRDVVQTAAPKRNPDFLNTKAGVLVPFQSNDRPETNTGQSATADDNVADYTEIIFIHLHH